MLLHFLTHAALAIDLDEHESITTDVRVFRPCRPLLDKTVDQLYKLTSCAHVAGGMCTLCVFSMVAHLSLCVFKREPVSIHPR